MERRTAYVLFSCGASAARSAWPDGYTPLGGPACWSGGMDDRFGGGGCCLWPFTGGAVGITAERAVSIALCPGYPLAGAAAIQYCRSGRWHSSYGPGLGTGYNRQRCAIARGGMGLQ